ncbi:hypothetical protein [Streptomyces gobiensis]|uniref:hypothetical protein n=1 Tax=Streptomyces gobiensis TaxID=2875706 RepID=UPI001E410451|nr:hypothetical protein [Streptomyces gobiensis]UGY93037.1 hypothetical protein test1122_15830 [Streptomyces gobiensis]
MALRTFVSMTVREDALDQARRTLWTLVTDTMSPAEFTSYNKPDAPTVVVVSVPGDAREEVAERLASLTSLPYEIEVQEATSH